MGASRGSPGAGGPERRRRWVRGCGAGCGLLLVLGIAALLAATFLLQRTFRGIADARASYEALVVERGSVEDYVPPNDGVPSAERWEVFLGVRQDTETAQAVFQTTVAQASSAIATAEGSFGTARAVSRAVARLIDTASAYLVARDRALEARGMGPGEYVYLYSLAYYSALGHRPGDAIAPPEAARADGEGQANLDLFGEDDALFGEAAVRRRYRRYTLGLLRAHLGSVDPADQDLRAALEREAHQMEVDPGRVLWQDGLPSAIAASLEPFRERLEAYYDPITNRIELPLAAHEMQ